jgi:hypothetical protein
MSRGEAPVRVPPLRLRSSLYKAPVDVAPSQDASSWAIAIIARLALSPSTPARQTACPLRASGVDRSARPSKRAVMPINAEACLSLPVNQSVDYAKQDTHIAQTCALGGSTKLSEGGFVLVSVEVSASSGTSKPKYQKGDNA